MSKFSSNESDSSLETDFAAVHRTLHIEQLKYQNLPGLLLQPRLKWRTQEVVSNSRRQLPRILPQQPNSTIRSLPPEFGQSFLGFRYEFALRKVFDERPISLLRLVSLLHALFTLSRLKRRRSTPLVELLGLGV